MKIRRGESPTVGPKTAAARRAHAAGVKAMIKAFGPAAEFSAGLPSRSWMNALDHRTRQMVRAAKAANDPTYPARRRRRQAARTARRITRAHR